MQIERIPAALLIVTGLFIPACAHNEGPTAEPQRPVPGTAVPEGVTNSQNAADLSLTNRIAAARCERAHDCNDIGKGHIYFSRPLCMDEVRGTLANKVNGYECPRGVDGSAVDLCLSALNVLECGKEATVASISDCKPDVLCLR